ncbi:MAG: YbaB/EbfC family nucleoid-associated protein [Bacteroidetes bacterium]|nr:YbaB/EbfC family nucleoid-associated protein [Bacteroidota bacterium]
MLGKFGDMMGKLQEAKKIAGEIKDRLDNTVLSVESAGGDIKIDITGNRKIKKITVASSLQHGDKTELEAQLMKAMNLAIEKADTIHGEEMKKVAGGLMPGLF